MNVIRGSDLIKRPWRNGGGITREITEIRHDADLVWRLSMADVVTDGPFSDFSGLMRVLTVIDGDAMELITPKGTLLAVPLAPLKFDGALSVTSRLTNGPLRDLNLMFDPQVVSGDVTPIHGPMTQSFTTTLSQSYALYLVSGEAQVTDPIGPETGLANGDTLILEADASGTRITLKEGCAALLISLTLID